MPADEDAMSASDLSDGVLRLVVSRQADGCALWHEAVPALTRRILAAGRDGSAGAVLLVGAGVNFCTGGNLRTFAAAEDPGATVGHLAREFHDFIRALIEGPLPVVAAVRGWAAGAGLSLVCAADLAVVGPGTRLRAGYPSLGYTSDGGLSWTLPRIVGAARARDLLLTDRILDGEESVRTGLAARLVADTEIEGTAAELSRGLAAGPTACHARFKRLLAISPDQRLADQLRLEEQEVAACADGSEGREGVSAFVQRRAPDFSGVSGTRPRAFRI